ncbi:MAG: uroporphyrinogen decarboxylase, partial [Woeseiaceae bacterium]|nr:uroporphyrinogen decarboxylase [Woeseiaceae bacterium]
LDAAILFSDILTVPNAMGLGLYFESGEGPKFKRPVQSVGAIQNLSVPNVEKDLRYVFDAVRTIRRELNGDVPLIGFAGSPFTVGTYMVEGGSSREFPTIKALAKEAPGALDNLMNIIAETTIEYLNGQIDAGAQAVQIFDTWGAVLDGDDFRRFSMASMQKIIDGLTREKDGRKIPVILFTKGAGPLLADLAETGCDALGVDWTTDLATARRYVGDKVALQGNLNPGTLLESPEKIRQGVADTLASYGDGPGHIFNLGHGITPDVDPDHLGVLVDAVHDLSPEFHP